MESSKRLRSVVQSLAHHAISGLSYIHPHIGRENANRNISLYLLSGETNPRIETPSKELVLSSQALKEKFIEILNAEKMDVSIVIETECSGQVNLAAVLEEFSNNSSALFGDNPPLC